MCVFFGTHVSKSKRTSVVPISHNELEHAALAQIRYTHAADRPPWVWTRVGTRSLTQHGAKQCTLLHMLTTYTHKASEVEISRGQSARAALVASPVPHPHLGTDGRTVGGARVASASDRAYARASFLPQVAVAEVPMTWSSMPPSLVPRMMRK